MSYKRYKQYKRSKAAKLSRKQMYVIAIVTVMVVSSLAVYAFFAQGSSTVLKAAIVDQLSSRQDFQNATFVKNANATLTAAGYTVTYYKGSDVTVDFYRYLPEQGYKLIIFRVHSALYNGTDAPLDLFTSEPYNPTAHIYDQAMRYIDIAMYQQGGDKFFGIQYGFIGNAMQGSFDNAIIIMMGCNGFDKYDRSLATLESLVGRGAKVVIGWSDAISMDHTDVATTHLLHHLLIENQTIKEAVNATNTEVGPDPTYGNVFLKYYPSNPSIGGFTVPQRSLTSTNVTDDFLTLGTVTFAALPASSSTNKSFISKGIKRLIF